MLPDLTSIEWLSVISFSVSLAALLTRFLTKKEKVSAKAHLLTAVAVFAIVSAGLATIYSLRRGAEVAALADSIYLAIGNQEKTTDQLMLEIGAKDDKNFTAALALLKSRRLLDSRLEQVSLYKDRMIWVRIWRAIPTE